MNDPSVFCSSRILRSNFQQLGGQPLLFCLFFVISVVVRNFHIAFLYAYTAALHLLFIYLFLFIICLFIYYSIFNSHLNYGSQIWGQKRDAHSSPLFHNTRIFKVFDQIQYQNVLLLHKIINKKIPQSIGESFTLMSHSHNTRINNPLVVPYSNTDSYGTYSIMNQCITAWNVYSEIFADKDLESLSNSVVKSHYYTFFEFVFNLVYTVTLIGNFGFLTIVTLFVYFVCLL